MIERLFGSWNKADSVDWDMSIRVRKGYCSFGSRNARESPMDERD